jgi:hypothetical protein
MSYITALTNEWQSLSQIAFKLKVPTYTIKYLTRKLILLELIERLEHKVKIKDGYIYDRIELGKQLKYIKDYNWEKIKCSWCTDTYDRKRILTEGVKKRYEDRDGRRWRGKKCPDCVDYEKELDSPKVVMTKRLCRECKDCLPVSRYFTCEKCQPALDNIDEDFMYHGVVGNGHSLSYKELNLDAFDTIDDLEELASVFDSIDTEAMYGRTLLIEEDDANEMD